MTKSFYRGVVIPRHGKSTIGSPLFGLIHAAAAAPVFSALDRALACRDLLGRSKGEIEFKIWFCPLTPIGEVCSIDDLNGGPSSLTEFRAQHPTYHSSSYPRWRGKVCSEVEAFESAETSRRNGKGRSRSAAKRRSLREQRALDL